MARNESQFDVAVIGGGIVGMATAMAMAETSPVSVVVLEAEDKLAAHQTGHNSGVIHSGLYYKPNSLKAQLCVQGREALYRFCAEHDVPHDRCGKVVVATSEDQIPRLDMLEARGRENGLAGLQRLDLAGLHAHEPHVCGAAGLLVPETGIVNYVKVVEAMAGVVRDKGHEVRTGARVRRVVRDHGSLRLETSFDSIRARYLINCCGLQSDRVARMCGVQPNVRIVPFRGEYYELVHDRQHLVRNLIYPVPDPQFPFLGVHFTRMIGGGVEAGPNAVLSFKREGYHRWSFSPVDTMSSMLFRGFWPMAWRHWRMGMGEFYRSFSKGAFVRALRALLPEIRGEDLTPAESGVRAQALGPDGNLLDDFRIVEGEGMMHVLNAPSPAATASIAIGRYIATKALERFEGPVRVAAGGGGGGSGGAVG